MQQLLPFLQQSTSLGRVVSVGGGTQEGDFDVSDIPGLKVDPPALRGHLSSVVTLGMDSVAASAPDVSFLHTYPGSVRTPLVEGMGMPEAVLAQLEFIPLEECGDRNVYLSTSARFPSKSEGSRGGEDVAKGNDGQKGSGFYSVGPDCETASKEVMDKLQEMRGRGVADEVAAHTRDEFARIEGKKRV